MSGDRMTKTDLLAPESLAKEPECDIFKKIIIPTTAAVTLPSHHYDRLYAQEGYGDLVHPIRDHQLGNVYTETVYGNVMRSTLNPNAVEFVPYFKQQNSKVIEQQNLVYEKENEKVILKESKESEHAPIVREQQMTIEGLNESSVTNAIIEENVRGTQGCFLETVENVEEDKKTTDLDDKKLEQNADETTNILYILFENSFPVKNTSSETVLTENVRMEQQTELGLVCSEHIETGGKKTCFQNSSAKPSSEPNILKEYSEVEKNNEAEHFKTEAKDSKEDGKHAATATVGAILKKSSIESGNKNKIIAKKQIQPFSNINSTRKNLNTNMKVATSPPTTATATTRTISSKVTFASKTSRTVELKSQTSQPKNKPIIPQHNLTRSCRVNSAAQTNSNIKSSSLLNASKPPPTKPLIQGTLDTRAKSLNKETMATDSAGKRILPNRSHLLNSKLNCAAKPDLQGQNQKPEGGCLSKNPRPTVASKLRKTETQKRRNLFFDIDSIQMSEFLFR